MTEALSKKKPLIYALYASPLSGPEVEVESFKIIDREAPRHSFSPEEWQVVRRMVHATGDFDILEAARFSPGAISSAITALREGAPIFTDSNMIRSGLSLARLRSVFAGYDAHRLICHVADEDVIRQARVKGLPRSLFGVCKAKPILSGAITVFGNAPIALMELNRMILEENIRPALVIAMPVGFVHVVESKRELMSLEVPYIALDGRRGGSPLAVSVVHALCSLASPGKNLSS